MEVFLIPNSNGRKLIWSETEPSGMVNGQRVIKGDVWFDETLFGAPKINNGTNFSQEGETSAGNYKWQFDATDYVTLGITNSGTATFTHVSGGTAGFIFNSPVKLYASANVSGSGYALTVTNSSVFKAYGDDAGALLGEGAVRSGVFRTLVTLSHSNETSIFGCQNQLKIKAPLDCTLTTGNRAGSWNYLEMAGTATKTLTLSGTDKVTGGCFSMVEWDGVGTLVLSANHVLAGFAALSNLTKTGGTFTETGKFCAFTALNNATASYSKWSVGMYLPADAVTQGINVGDFSSTATASGVALSSTVTAGNRFYADDAGSAISAVGSVPDVRNLLARTLITADNTSNHMRLSSLMGHVKSYDGKWNTEQTSGVYGYLELFRNAGTITFGGYGVSAGVLGEVETSGTMTVDTNHIIAGVAAISKLTSGLTQTGKTAAFYAGIYDTTNWSDGTARSKWGYGLYISASGSTCGISVGDYAASYATGSGLAFAAANTAIARFYGESTVDLTSAINARTVVSRHLVSCATDTVINHEAYGLIGQLCVKNGSLNHYHGGVMGTFESETLAHVQSSYGVGALIGRVGAEHTTIESGGLLAGVLALSNTTDNEFTHTGIYAAFAAKTAAGKHAFTSLIEVPSDLATAQNATGVPGANPMVIEITVNGVSKKVLCADSWATS